MNSHSLPPDLARTLETGLAELALDAALAAPLLAYLELLGRWNRTYNLTAVRDPGEMVVKHLLDSLAMHPFVDPLLASGGALADLGTGAGLPGIPLAIAKPGLQVTLVESAGKKARFLREAVRTLGLTHVRVAETRIEAFDEPGPAQFGNYAAITARALATLPLILELGGHLLRADGRLLAMKGAYPADEIAALPAGWALQESHPLRVPGLAADRHLVVVGRVAT
jgi:16S rRNA (guanine527-N7)-methyltransferase